MQFTKKDDYTNWKSDSADWDTNKLKTFSVNLSELSGVVNNDVVKKDVYYTDKAYIKSRRCRKQIPDVSKLVTNNALDTEIGEVEKKVTDISELVTNSVLNIKIKEVKNKISNHNLYITAQEFNK